MSGATSRAPNLSRLIRPDTTSANVKAKLDATQPMSSAFPSCEPGIVPFGSRVLIQIRSPKSKSAGGIILPSDVKESEKWNQQVGRVYSLGPVAFHDRKTLQPWPEGEWAQPGMFVRTSKYGGDKWEVPVGDQGETALFVMFNDTDLIGEVTCDPRLVKAFI
jgi:co-chaperonin GroES (HSP10)